MHRSEGFGRGIAEALQLGLDVIATDFGGNTDFCTGPLAHPVRWRQVPIPRGSYKYADGHSWAEPDLDHAAQLCRHVAENRYEIASGKEAVVSLPNELDLTEYRRRFSFSEVGLLYRHRLEAIWKSCKSP